ncbi:MAG: tRNA 2-thiouridine(34) synthase MnmA [Planctomycetota bacterium]|nr:tRNA 2-thiouridine(34) synthase MnmA [Planctomycetota bacterium]
MARVLVAMSGGVDSSVAAHLLQQQGHEVIGAFLRLGDGGQAAEKSRACCTVEDAIDARRVADLLKIPFYSFNYADQFRKVIDYFVDEYRDGRTPNPCARCNQWIKFDVFHDLARDLDAEFVATGHYTRVLEADDGPRLARGVDTDKDQSYFLATVPYSVLTECIFPVGHLSKTEVRDLAGEANLPVVQKAESQEICFVPANDYRRVIRKEAPESLQQGDIIDEDGGKIGTHEGYAAYTVGQRRGLGIAAGEPRYVVKTDRQTNQVVLGPRDSLLEDRFEISEINWLRPTVPRFPLRCTVQIRHGGTPQSCTVTVKNHEGVERINVELDSPIFAIAAGQVAALYEEDVVIGGGWIEKV